MAELADAQASGACLGSQVQVQVLLPAPNSRNPNLVPIGEGFGFLFCILCSLSPAVYPIIYYLYQTSKTIFSHRLVILLISLIFLRLTVASYELTAFINMPINIGIKSIKNAITSKISATFLCS